MGLKLNKLKVNQFRLECSGVNPPWTPEVSFKADMNRMLIIEVHRCDCLSMEYIAVHARQTQAVQEQCY